MARTVTITDGGASISIAITNTLPTTKTGYTNINKADINNISLILPDQVAIIPSSDCRTTWILDWNDVDSPVVTSGLELMLALEAMLNNQAGGIKAEPGTFEDSDLVANVLTIIHSLGTEDVTVTLRNSSGGLETAFPATVVDDATITIDFGGSIGAGTWGYLIIGAV
jgi:hypothetical protein